jgi:hypothetical protein
MDVAHSTIDVHHNAGRLTMSDLIKKKISNLDDIIAYVNYKNNQRNSSAQRALLNIQEDKTNSRNNMDSSAHEYTVSIRK